ncbi:hypothetical protein BRC97_07935 [Halobacteriales archaeon QS_6_71_20]|nr:MAG: hypothetical protein BRC97_07935 [Halobacteriales archaeon QS_6_71_20]
MPVTIDATATTVGAATLVTVRVHNDEPVARRVRLANRLDGAVLPPRRHGLPEPGWSADGYVGTIPAEGTVGLGYACQSASDPDDSDRPVELVDVSDPDDADPAPLDRARSTLPDARPPSAVVGAAPPAEVESADPVATGADDGATGFDSDEHCDDADRSEASTADATQPAATSDAEQAVVPSAVADYLADVEGRVTDAETFAEGSLADATALLEAGIDPEAVERTVAADAAALARLRERAATLAARAAAVEVPTETMERLA